MLASNQKSVPKHKAASTSGAFLCFSLPSYAKAPRARAKFAPHRRNEVAAVRKRGACLRCRLLKIKCDEAYPCQSCMRLATTVSFSQERKTLHFSECIRTQLHTISIFQHALPTREIQRLILAKTKNLTTTAVTLDMGPAQQLDISALIQDLTLRLNNSRTDATTIAASLSSPDFLILVQPVFGKETSTRFQRLIYGESLSCLDAEKYASDDHLTEQEIECVGSMAGHDCLVFLDRTVTPQALSSRSKEEIQSLFLVLVLTMAAVHHARSSSSFPVFPPGSEDRVPDQQGTLFEAIQQHLSLILAHFAIYLGCHLKLQITTDAERLILSNSASRLLIGAPLQNPPPELEIFESLSANEPIPLGVRSELAVDLDSPWIRDQQFNFHPYQNEMFRMASCNGSPSFWDYSRESSSTAKTYSCPSYPGERLVSSPPKDMNLSNSILHYHRLSEYNCEKCGYGLYGREMLRIHMRTQHGLD